MGAGQTGSLSDAVSWQVRIPEGVRDVIGRRLDRLSQRCNDTLTIASVIGREFTLAQLKPLLNDSAVDPEHAMTEDRLLEVVEEALASRVIEELPSSVGRFQFTHALIQEALAEELSATRRVRLHARIAQAWRGFMVPRPIITPPSWPTTSTKLKRSWERKALSITPCWPESGPWPPTPMRTL